MKKILFAVILVACFCQAKSQDIYIDFKSPTLIKGEGATGVYSSMIYAEAVNMGLANAGTLSGPGTGTSAPDFSDIVFQHKTSINSPIFSWAVATAQPFQNVEILFTKLINGNQTVTYKVKLEDAYLTSYALSSTNDCASCAFGYESISLTFRKITWEDPINKVTRSYDRSTPIK